MLTIGIRLAAQDRKLDPLTLFGQRAALKAVDLLRELVLPGLGDLVFIADARADVSRDRIDLAVELAQFRGIGDHRGIIFSTGCQLLLVIGLDVGARAKQSLDCVVV